MASERFTVDGPRTRVAFGTGAADDLLAELGALGVERVLIVTTPGRARALDAVRASARDRIVGVCDLAALHVPRQRVSAAVEAIDRLEADALLAVGGGSAIGLAKAAALERPLPIIAIPTTYAGSEMTSIWGVTDGDLKRTGRDARVAPRLVIYDPRLTLSLPPAVSAASGMNAMAHAVEALYGANASPEAAAAADDALRCLSRALPLVVTDPSDLEARVMALRGAYFAGVALELGTMGLHHKICHVLGGTFGLPHAETHAVLLPHVVAFNAPAAPGAMSRIAEALGARAAMTGLRDLNRTLGLTMTLADLGLRKDDIPRAARLVAAGSYPNPRPVTEAAVVELLTAAWDRGLSPTC